MDDTRFTHIKNDPKFRHIPKGERKVKIDKRFQSMFNDKQFKVKYSIDKRGRPVSHTSTEDLKRYYHLSSEESSDSESEDEDVEVGKYVKSPNFKLEPTNIPDANDSKKVPLDIKKKLKNLSVDYARGECALHSESSSNDEESEEELSEDEGIDHKWGELDADAEITNETTNRLACCNMDWDRIRALDIMVILNSFLPPGGAITSVVIYPSEFGKHRMKEEETKGPMELVDCTEDMQNETEDGSKYHMEKLRQYQLNRLKYYYAVITFDNEVSANKVYTECDGMEYESSSTKIDLRYIPDDLQFEDEPREICDKIPEVNKYQPRFFTTTALQQAKVDLTWDETDPDRLEITQKINSGKIDDIDETDLQNYLAPSSDEESGDEEEQHSDSETDNPIEKYKALLQDIEVKEKEKENKDVEMEITWGLDIKDKTDKLMKQKQAEREERTPFQLYLEKRKDKRKEKREIRKNKRSENSDDEASIPSDIDMNDPYFAEEFDKPEFKKKKKVEVAKDIDEQNHAELELLLMNEDGDDKHFSLKQIQENEFGSNKKKKKKEINEKSIGDFEVNVNDARFSAIYSSHHYNIDPTDSHYKKTHGMEKLITTKLKRRTENSEQSSKKVKQTTKVKKDPELSVLIKSVKRKTEAFSNKNK